MKRLVGVVLMLIGVAIAGAGLLYGRGARAQLADPPAKMELVDAARVDAALAHLQPYVNTLVSIGQRYQISPLDLLTGRVHVDFDTGQITRPEPQKGTK